MKFIISPEGNAAVDTKNFIEAIESIPSTGGNLVILDKGKPLKLDDRVSPGVTIDKPVIIQGSTPNAKIEKRGKFYISFRTLGVPTRIKPNTVSNPRNNTHDVWTFKGIEAGHSQFTCRGLQLKKGDWVTLLGDDPIPGSPTHFVYRGRTSPLELHRVAHVSEKSVVTLSSFVKNRMMVNPRVQRMKMINNAGICDLTLGVTEDTAGSTTNQHLGALFFDSVLNFRMHNVTVDDSGFGFTFLRRGAHCKFEGFSGFSQPNPKEDYGFVIICGNDVTWKDSFWHESRHAFTTSGFGINEQRARYAGMTNVGVDNVSVYLPGDETGHSYSAFHTHPEGEVTFRRCKVYASGQDQITGYNVKAKGSRLLDCEFYGNVNTDRDHKNTHIAVRLLGADQTVKRCHIERAWLGVRFYRGAKWSNYQIDDNDFVDCTSAAIHIAENVEDVSITRNRIKRSGYFDNSGRPTIRKTLIDIQKGKNFTLRGNELDADQNDYAFAFSDSIDPDGVVIEGNYNRGYGDGKLGVLGDEYDPNGYSSTIGQDINRKWAQSNYTD